MKLVINCSTLSSTGPVQVAVSFIYECLRHNNHDYIIFLSPSVYRNIEINDFPANFTFYKFEHHPAFGIKGIITKKAMNKIVDKMTPDCVFSIFGPTTWKPNLPHLQGFASGHYVYKDSPVYKIMSIKERFKRLILGKIQLYFLKRDGKYYVCESDDVSNRLSDILNINRRNVYTVTNSYSHYFIKKKFDKMVLPSYMSGTFKFLILSSAAQHKNLCILNEVIPILLDKYPSLKINFVVTIDDIKYKSLFNKHVQSYIYNIGSVSPSDCPQLYYETDALFAPTLLECFSANYPEAMIMERPIITTDLSFAHSICGDAALYFSPLDPYDAVDKINTLVNNSSLRSLLVKNGKKQLSKFDTSKSRADKYLKICEDISTLENYE